jgi:protein disulfide-isomerase
LGLVLVLASGPAFAQDQIVWQADIAKAVKQAKAERKLVLVHFYGDSCKPCKEVEKNVFPQPEVVQAMMRNYVPVKVNIDKNEKIAAFYGIRSIPQDLFLAGGSGQVLNRTTTMETPAEYANFLDNYAIQTGSGTAREASFRERSARYEQEDVAGAAPQNIVQNQYVAQAEAQRNRYVQQGGAAQNQFKQQVEYGESPSAPIVSSRGRSQSGPDGAEAWQSNSNFESQRGNDPHGFNRPDVAQPNMERTTFQDQADITGRQPTRNVFIPLKDIPPIGLDGYCPVSVAPGPNQVWKKGDPRFGAVHRGRTYLFASATEQGLFLADPDAYCPVLSGADPVIFAETGKLVDGKRVFGISVANNGRDEMYLFATEENQKRFWKDPRQFSIIAHQAMLKGETEQKLR